jgi:hypothetical protein
MRGRSALLIAGLFTAGAALASAPATAKPIDKGHFHDVFTSDVYNCDGTAAQDSVDVSGNFLFNQRGSSPFPYYRESVRLVNRAVEIGALLPPEAHSLPHLARPPPNGAPCTCNS